MRLERNDSGGPPASGVPDDLGTELTTLLFTLDVCRRALPGDTHPEHFERLRRIEGMVRWSLEQRARLKPAGGDDTARSPWHRPT
jgi:hypothetical protein